MTKTEEIIEVMQLAKIAKTYDDFIRKVSDFKYVYNIKLNVNVWCLDHLVKEVQKYIYHKDNPNTGQSHIFYFIYNRNLEYMSAKEIITLWKLENG
jgi:hypothetical protein